MFSLEQYGALKRGAGLVDRTGRGRLRIQGEDRRSYLQGLLTNDIAALTAGTGCYAALLTPQGRMISDMRVFELGDAVLLDLERDVTATVHNRLEQFVFSEDVQVLDISDSSAELGVYGPTAAATVDRALAAHSVPRIGSRLAEMRTFDNARVDFAGVPVLILSSDDVGVQGLDMVVDVSRREDLAHALRAAGAVDVSPETAEVSRIEAGRPRFHRDMDEDTIPLEAGIEDRAISLTKGCYVGQEIIIRVLHRGHGRVARRLIGLVIDHASPVPQPGAAIRAGERQIGLITSAAFSPALDRPVALGYVHRDFAQPSTAVTITNSASELNAVVSKLPFESVAPWSLPELQREERA